MELILVLVLFAVASILFLGASVVAVLWLLFYLLGGVNLFTGLPTEN